MTKWQKTANNPFNQFSFTRIIPWDNDAYVRNSPFDFGFIGNGSNNREGTAFPVGR